jgi:hypothetical protein
MAEDERADAASTNKTTETQSNNDIIVSEWAHHLFDKCGKCIETTDGDTTAHE